MINNESILMKRALRCPVCGAALMLDRPAGGAGTLRCGGARAHCFDVARSGYAHLAPRHSGGGDSKEAVRARTEFLSAGHYAAAAAKLNELLQTYLSDGLVIDAGCGEGYYTNAVQASNPGRFELCGFDLSRAAVEAAAKAARRETLESTFFVASVFELPLTDESVDAVVNVFAPCAETEYARVLRPGGILIVVGAGERHLLGLKRAIYENTYENTARADLPADMELIDRVTVNDEITVRTNEQIRNLFSMTPYYWRTSRADVEKLSSLDELTTEISFDFMVYRK